MKYFLLSLMIFFTLNISLAETSTKWFKAATTPLKGYGLVVHGLNTNPSKMNALVATLQGQGIEVLRVSLSTGSEVTAEAWLTEVLEAYSLVKKEAGKLPLYYLGFSLGGVLGETLLNSELKDKIEFSKVILFAPAISIRPRSFLIKGLFFLSKKTTIPSAAPPEYRANPGTTLAAYRALFDLEKKFKETKCKKANIPTLIFIDPDDELVNFNGIKKIKQTYNLSQWTIHEVSNKGTTLKKSYHHLIIDSESVGVSEWEKISESINQFLKEPLSFLEQTGQGLQK